MLLAVIFQRWLNSEWRQRKQRLEIKGISLIELNLLLEHHLIERGVERATIGATDRAGHSQERRPRRP